MQNLKAAAVIIGTSLIILALAATAVASAAWGS